MPSKGKQEIMGTDSSSALPWGKTICLLSLSLLLGCGEGGDAAGPDDPPDAPVPCLIALPQCEEPLVERIGEEAEGGHRRQGNKHGQARVELRAGEKPEPPLAEHPGACNH